MIGRLTGRIVAQEDDGAVVVDVSGVGYEVVVPIGTAGRCATDDDGRATLFVHTHAREDALTLFGFATDADRLAFRTLISISNVGPKTAIGILSALPGPDLARAIAAKDVGRLVAIPGVGKKTAERLLLELRDKIATTALAQIDAANGGAAPSRAGATGAAAAAGAPPAAAGETLKAALTRMGYRPAEAERAVAALGPRAAELPIADALREALAALTK